MIDTTADIVTIMEQKFTSGNKVPVTVSRITLDEWKQIKELLQNKKINIMSDDAYKPCTITTNGVEVPEPVREGLSPHQKYWLADITAGIPRRIFWKSSQLQRLWLEDGLIHLTYENAQAHIDAVLRA